MTAAHSYDCDWQLDQYDFECTCGLTRPKAEGFDEHERRSKIMRAKSVLHDGGLTLADLVPEGWRLVPVTPTEAMLANGREALIPVLPRSALATYGWVTGIWADMLANAPAPPSNGGEARPKPTDGEVEAETRAKLEGA